MEKISEQNFKAVLDGLWMPFAKSIGLINMLESLGLSIDGPRGGGPHFGDLFAMQEAMSTTVLKLFGMDEGCLGPNGHMTVMEELDEFFYDVYTAHPDSSTFPESCYQKLLDILTASGGISPPWEDGAAEYHPEQYGYTGRKYRYHRGISIYTGTPVHGYLLRDRDGSFYILPEGRITEEIKAEAIKVLKDTVTFDVDIKDDNNVLLFDGDTVKSGSDDFVLSPFIVDTFDPHMMEKLAGPERKKNHGLFVVKRNYD